MGISNPNIKDVEFSVVIPTKDRLHELKQTILSIYAQTHLPREIVIIDDESDIPLTQKMLPVPPEGVILVIQRNEKNKGGSFSLNRGLQASSFPYVATIDSDDCYLPNALEKMAEFWLADKNNSPACAVGFFWCDYDLQPYRIQSLSEPVSYRDLLEKGNVLGGGSVMCLKKEAFVASGGYPPIKGSHDYGFWMRLALLGDIATIPDPLVLYRSPSTNIVPTYTKNYRKQILALCKLRKSLPEQDKETFLTTLHSLLLLHFSKWGRVQYAKKMFCLSYRRTKAIRKIHIKALLILVMGGKIYDYILCQYACVRAQLFSRKLLESAHINQDYLDHLQNKKS